MFRIGSLSVIGFVLGSLLGVVSCSTSPNELAAMASEMSSVDAGVSQLDAGAVSGQMMMCVADQTAPAVTQMNLVADKADLASVADPNLVNAWGLAFNPQGVAWISANGTGLAIAYDSSGKEKIAVTVPPPSGGQPPAAPTGQLFNGNSSAFMGDVFIFVTEDGTVSGWQPSAGTTGVLRVDNSATNAVYKGATIVRHKKEPMLFAADFHNGKIDAFDAHYNQVALQPGAFSDSCLPDGYAPFNVLARDDRLFVTYALQNEEKKDDVKGAGHGFVNVYDLKGRRIERLISRGALNSPWGMAFKTDDKTGSVELLIGNFGDGRINVYELALRPLDFAAKFVGPIVDSTGTAITIEGLWAITWGPDAGGFSAKDLYFTAGPNDEKDGLFGKLVMP